MRGELAGELAQRAEKAGPSSSMRWLVVSDDIVSADWMATELRRSGDVVRLVDANGLELSRLGAFDAQVLLACQGQDLRFLQTRLVMHPGLRWATPLFVTYPDPWQDEGATFIQEVRDKAASLTRADRELELLARKPSRRFEAPLETIGPVRVLRALCGHEDVFRVRFNSAQHEASVDIAGNLVLGAVFERGGEPMLCGAEALAGVLELSCGRATIEHRPSLDAPLLSLSLERALERAYEEVRERRLSRDADSPTLRMRSPLSRVPRKELEHELTADAELVTTRTTTESNADTKLMEPLPELLYYTPSVSGIVPRPPEQMKTLDTTLQGARFTPTQEIVTRETSRTRSALRIGVCALSLALLTFVVVRWGRISQATGDASRALRTEALEERTVRDPSPAPASVSKTVRLQAPTPPSSVRTPAAPTAPRAPATARSAGVKVPPKVESVGEAPPASSSPKGAQALLLAAQQALREGDAQTAVSLSARALALRPRRATYLILHGDALLAAGQPEAALEQYRAARARQPHSRALERRIGALTSP